MGGRPSRCPSAICAHRRDQRPRAGQGILFEARDLGAQFGLEGPGDQETALPLQITVRNTLRYLGLRAEEADWRLVVTSDIPVARGLGSGTAVATALARAVAAHCGREIPPADLSTLVFETEVLLHGTPSGIDNTVVAYESPLSFRRGQAPEFLACGAPLTLVLADTGVPSRTRDAVGAVRAAWQAAPERYEACFDAIDALVAAAREALAAGDAPALGRLMDANQERLVELGVSSPELDALVAAARAAGAWGAKLSGGGRGGFMLRWCRRSGKRTWRRP
jgi:mevalonate kinase